MKGSKNKTGTKLINTIGNTDAVLKCSISADSSEKLYYLSVSNSETNTCRI